MAYDVLHSELTYQGKLVDIQQDQIVLPSGRKTIRETVIRKKNAAAVLPILPDGKLLFVRQYRHAAKKMMLEIPAGVLETGEDFQTAAKRELEEETGKTCKDLKFLCRMYPTVGFCSEQVAIFLAERLEEGTQHLDPGEFITLEQYTLKEALQMIAEEEVEDGKTIAAIFAYAASHKAD